MQLDSASNGPVIRQRAILGYGSELTDALSIYRAAAGDKTKRHSILKNFAKWAAASARLREHLCFADIYYRPDSVAPIKEAISLLITPQIEGDLLEGHKRYRAALKEFWGEDHERAFAPHSNFSSGLPLLVGGDTNVFPETEEELRTATGTQRREPCLFIEQIEATKLQEMGEPNVETGEVLCAAEQKLVASELGNVFEDRLDLRVERISNTSVLWLWRQWVRAFRKRTTVFKSHANSPLSWLLAMPVGFCNTGDESSFSGFATLFVGFDETLSREEVFEAMRYILLHLSESNATALARREGQRAGKSSAMTTAAHDISRVVGAIQHGNPQVVLDLVRDFFQRIVDEAAIANDVPASAERASASLREIVLQSALKAARLVRLESLAKKSSIIGEGEAADAFQEIEDWLNGKIMPLDISSHARLLLSNFERNSLELALMEAIRNAIRHVRDSELRCATSETISITFNAASKMISIQNSITRRSASPYVRGKEQGTLGSLQGHARIYNSGNAVPVKLELKQRQASNGRVVEFWSTDLPTPELSPVTL